MVRLSTGLMYATVCLMAGGSVAGSGQEPPSEAQAHDVAYAAVNVAATETRISEKSLIWVGQRKGFGGADDDVSERQAVRIYRFTLKPKERLKVTLTSEDAGLIVMKFVRILRTDPLTRQVNKANFPAEPVRRKKIQIENPLDAPQDCFLQLEGKRNFPYTMDLTREGLS